MLECGKMTESFDDFDKEFVESCTCTCKSKSDDGLVPGKEILLGSSEDALYEEYLKEKAAREAEHKKREDDRTIKFLNAQWQPVAPRRW